MRTEQTRSAGERVEFHADEGLTENERIESAANR